MPSKRTSRIQLMFDDEELAALDEWRFSRRMPSRAAAMRALMRFGLKMDVDVDDLGVDPASVASNKIGVVDGVDIDPESERRELLASLLGQDVIDLLDQYAKLRGLALRDAMYQACSSALNAIAAEEGEGTRAPTRS